MSSLPAWYPDPSESKAAPMPLLLVQAFLNTRDLEAETDVLSNADAARAWLQAAGLLPRRSSLEPAGLSLALEVREGLRSLLASNGDGAGPGALQRLTETHRLQMTVDDHGVFAVENAPRDDGLEDRLFGLLLIVHNAQQHGTWTRLKACANPECGWVYYDRSRNQQGNWCDMAVCGNRLKNRALRARQR